MADSRILDACLFGDLVTLERLTQPPYNLTRIDGIYAPLLVACSNGHLNILERLTQHPFNLTQKDARYDDNAALRMACENGHLNILERLTQPPFNLSQIDARSKKHYALDVACKKGHFDIVDRLTKSPFNLSQLDAQSCGVADNETWRSCIRMAHIKRLVLSGQRVSNSCFSYLDDHTLSLILNHVHAVDWKEERKQERKKSFIEYIISFINFPNFTD